MSKLHPTGEDKQPVPTWEEYMFRRNLYQLFVSNYSNKEIKKLTKYTSWYIAKWRYLFKIRESIRKTFWDRTNRENIIP